MRVSLSLALLASAAQALSVDVTCPNAPSSFSVNGTENGDLTVTAGETIMFNVNCSAGFQITSNGNAYLEEVFPQGIVTEGMVELNTSATTPKILAYEAADNTTNGTAMQGWIFVQAATNTTGNTTGNTTNTTTTAATRPSITSVSQVPDLPNLAIRWSAGTAGSCIFSSWNVRFANGGTVLGCTNLTSVTTTSCVAMLNSSTSYSFTVQRVCTNPLLNSNISLTSSAQTTLDVSGSRICQNVDTCNCGNASLCICQLTRVCNCERSGRCICQGGICNGGYTGELVCNMMFKDCNKQCAKSCLTCFGDTVAGYLGADDTCSEGAVIHASTSLLAMLAVLCVFVSF